VSGSTDWSSPDADECPVVDTRQQKTWRTSDQVWRGRPRPRKACVFVLLFGAGRYLFRGSLEYIFRRIGKDNPTAARETVKAIYEGCGALKDFPHRGRPGRSDGGRWAAD
jgi:hypothetical protein